MAPEVKFIHSPEEELPAGRPLKTGPLYDRLLSKGAVYGARFGWERPLWFAEAPSERDFVYSYGEQCWWGPAAREAEATTNAVTLFELSPFTKIDVIGPDALALLQQLCANGIDVAVGRAEYPSLERMMDGLRRLEASVLTLDATHLALQAGNARAANAVMLGGLFSLGLIDLTEQSLFAAMEERWPRNLVEINRKAYDLGHRAVVGTLGEAR